MSTIAPPPWLTTEDVLDLPDEGVDRELILGELREKPMTTRNPWHSGTEPLFSFALISWLKGHPELNGRILSGEAAFRISRNPDTLVGIDVAYAPADLPIVRIKRKAFFDGVPILAVEILSPSDAIGEVNEKVRAYLDAGVRVVWVVEPEFRYVIAYRPDAEPGLFNVRQELTAEPDLPGFRAPVAGLFAL